MDVPEREESGDLTEDVLEERERLFARAENDVDLLCPMAYRKDTREVARLLGTARAAAPRTPMWGGLMAYDGEPSVLREQVDAARAAGCEGAILFAYDPAKRDLLDAFAGA